MPMINPPGDGQGHREHGVAKRIFRPALTGTVSEFQKFGGESDDSRDVLFNIGHGQSVCISAWRAQLEMSAPLISRSPRRSQGIHGAMPDRRREAFGVRPRYEISVS